MHTRKLSQIILHQTADVIYTTLHFDSDSTVKLVESWMRTTAKVSTMLFVILNTFLTERANSIKTASNDSQGERNEDLDDNYEKIQSISLPGTIMMRGLSISVVREKTVKVNFNIVDTKKAGEGEQYVVSDILISISQPRLINK